MRLIIAFIIVSVGLWGLIQWAKSGASMWESASLTRRKRKMHGEERLKVEEEIRQLDLECDRRLKTSFKILAGLLIAVWLMLAGAIILRFFGLEGWARNRLEDVYMRARNYWNSGIHYGPQEEIPQSTPERKKMLKELGSSLRK